MAHGLKQLDLEKTEVKTTYCVSQDVREDQMRIAISKVIGRLVPSLDLHGEPIAIVCYGPSLRQTWPELRKFKKIITCSGAHKFLIDKGIIPTWHVDLDPREHKVRMLGEPHRDVEYLMASCCHPGMWEVLKSHNVKLWHIFNNEDNREVSMAYPRGEWILTGGNNVGLRCMVVARVLGYVNQHVFGMDCSFPKEGSHHADTHLNANKKLYQVPYEGKTFYVEPVMMTYAKQFFHEIAQLPDVSVRLYGDGLLQHMAVTKKHEKVIANKSVAIAFNTPVIASSEHLDAMRKLHLDPLYGIGSKKHKDVVVKLCDALKTRSVLDYGCGKGLLADKLPFPIWEYDPAMPGKDGVPRPADLVICINVLEVVEAGFLDNVLGDLVRCSKVCVFAIIEGSKEWWEKKLHQFFKIGAILSSGSELHCVLEPRKMGPLA